METVQNTSIQSLDYRDLPIRQLVESPTNPRKRYDESALRHASASRQIGRAREGRERIRAEQRKQEERRKEDLATRRWILSAILGRVSAPLTRTITREFVNRLAQEYRTILGQRHAEIPKGEQPKSSAEINTALKNLDEVDTADC